METELMDKKWADLTPDEKCERLRQHVKIGDQHNQDLVKVINKLRSELMDHRHLEIDGQVVSTPNVPEAVLGYDYMAAEEESDDFF